MDGFLYNSYLEMIYRSGVVGLGLISIIFILLFGMIKRFVKFKSLGGVFLISIIVYWLTTAFVYVTFELPYSAISFWWIFGWNLAHSHRLKAENVEKEKG